MCKVHPYKFGEKVTLTMTGNANCMGCGASVRSWLPSVECTYAGSNGDMCLFTYLKPERCPSCGELLTGQAEMCGGDSGQSGLDWSQVEPVMQPDELNQYYKDIDGF